MFHISLLSFNTPILTLYSPYTPHSQIGITNIGVLVWTVAPDSEASLYKTLIANTEVGLLYYYIALPSSSHSSYHALLTVHEAQSKTR